MTNDTMPLPPLPKAFIQAMERSLGSEVSAFLDIYRQPPVRGIRTRDAVRFFPADDCLSPIPWAEDAWYLKEDSMLGAHPLHDAGAFYIQEPSAMAAAAALDVQPDDMVLDLCAAPGGKSIQLANRLLGGVIVCNDIVLPRARVLSANIERMGIRCAAVTCASPEQLAEALPCAFDKVLVDAPCSGEGMFRKDPQAHLSWNESAPAGCAKRQRDILAAAAKMLKPGGLIAYATCTFNRVENEDVIEDFLRSHPDFSPKPFALKGLDKADSGMLRIWPHKTRGEGHFIALMTKNANIPLEHNVNRRRVTTADANFLADAGKLLAQIVDGMIKPNSVLGSTAVHVPDRMPHLNGVQVLRLGLHTVYRRQKTLLPDHALALGATPLQAVKATMAEARTYQRGEVLQVPDNLTGWAAPVLHGFALGWGKAAGGLLKNHYPKGLRAIRKM